VPVDRENQPKIQFADEVEERSQDDFADGPNGHQFINPIIQLHKDYIAAQMFTPQKPLKENVTIDELRRDLFLRRKRRHKFRDFNSERQEDRKNVEKIKACPLPIKRSMLIKDTKSISRKSTRMSLKMKEMGFTPSLSGQNTITDMDTVDKDLEYKLKFAMKKNLKHYKCNFGEYSAVKIS